MSKQRAPRKRVKKIRLYSSVYEYAGADYSFALLSAPDDNGLALQATSFAGCKDYLQDSIQNHLRNKPFGAYGNYQGYTIIGGTDKLRLLVKYGKGSPETRMIATRDFLRLAERELKISPRTTVALVHPIFDTTTSAHGEALEATSQAQANSRRAVLFTASRAWMKSPTMISLYSLLIRLSHHHQPGEEFFPCLERILSENVGKGGADVGYLRNSLDGIRYLVMMGHRRLFGNNKDLIKNYPADIGLHSHGIQNFSMKNDLIIKEKLKETEVQKPQQIEIGATKRN